MGNREEGRNRVVIENVKPEVDGGRFPIKRTVGEKVLVGADIFADGSDVLSCVLKFRLEKEPAWHEVSMSPLSNDRWGAEFTVTEIGRHRYALEAWVDAFRTWQRGLEKKRGAGQNVALELPVGADLVEAAAKRAGGSDAERLRAYAAALRPRKKADASLPLSEELTALMERYPDRSRATVYAKELPVVVDQAAARFSAWYEMFPRSCSGRPGKHGTFKDCERRLPYVAAMGFDVLYLPPIHPVGRAFRKGKNNTLKAGPNDPGSPWAIGSADGGHKSIHPELGNMQDFKRLVRKAREHGLEVALDIAFQCTPDHPYVREHPEWFRRRPDGAIQYAENPPKKYQDIYPLDFETPTWRGLWDELKSVVLFWAGQGIRLFRV
ncbi:MAG: maltotransferase domain-containing protein, partial [bacterium]